MLTAHQINVFIGVPGIGATIEVEDHVDENIQINDANYKANWLVIKNITFNGRISFSDVFLGVGVYFENCVFRKGLLVNNVHARGREDDFLNESKNFVFKKCSFDKRVEFRGLSNFERDLSFEDCTLTMGILVEDLTISVQRLDFKKSVINEWFDLNRANLKMGFSFSDCVVDTRVRFYLGNIDSISIVNSNFKKDIFLWGCNVKQSVTINDGEFDDGIIVKELSGSPTLSIHGGKFKEAFTVTYNDKVSSNGQGVKKYYLSSCEFINGFYVHGVQKLTAAKPTIENITLPVTARLMGDISFNNLDIGVLEMSGLNAKANLFFSNVLINQLHIKNFINNSQLIFSDVSASISNWYYSNEENSVRPNAIRLISSNLGKALFFQMNFESFSKILIHNVILSEIRTSNVTWFSAEKLKLVDEEPYLNGIKESNMSSTAVNTLIHDYKSRREIFRQLKYAMSSQGDAPQSLEFRKWEMDYFRRYLELDANSLWEDRFILWSSLSNQFGQSWLTALGWGFLFTFLFYIPLALISSTKIDCFAIAVCSDDVILTFKEVFWSQLYIYPQLLNPTHYLKRIIPFVDSMSVSIHFFDFIHRIITAYFIFQIVSAFRKYVK